MRIAGAIPFFVMTAGNFAGNFKKTQGVAVVLIVFASAMIAKYSFNGLSKCIGADLGVSTHDDEFIGGQAPWFEQDGIGNADLDDVVQGSCLGNQFLGHRVELAGKFWSRT